MYLAIIILPLLGSIASGFFGRKIGVSGAQFITSTAVVTTTMLAVLAFFEVGLNNIPGRVTGKRVYGGKLSNSGELLKLKVPSHNRKIVGG
jgi:NADH:ubiquinone oxidoreductase subunit 5 (subunit L)/multisubunit Na+/H+ antiporter MnhA subunit